MDYVDQVSMVMFTYGQVARMNARLQGARASLLSSQGPKGLLAVTALGRFAEADEQIFEGVSSFPVGAKSLR
jgi:hypothetical protein